MEEMRAMKDSVLEIESIMVGRSLGWVGAANTVTMVIDLKDRNAFDTLMAKSGSYRSWKQGGRGV